MKNFFKKKINKKEVKKPIQYCHGIQLEDGEYLTFTFNIDGNKEEAPEWVYRAFEETWESVKDMGLPKRRVIDIVILNVVDFLEKEYNVVCYADYNGKIVRSDDEVMH